MSGTKVPRLIGTPDLKNLKLTAVEGFLMSRINGSLTIAQIASETGQDVEAVVELVDKLEKAYVVSTAPPGQTVRPPAPPPPPVGPKPIPTGRYKPAELAEACDLDDDQKKRVLDLFYAVSDCDSYRLLGVAREADKKAIKRAYYEVAAAVHPDKFFRKNLGAFKAKMEAVFHRLTEAHDTLTDKVKRAEYDAYLETVGDTQELEDALSHAAADVAAAQEALLKEFLDSKEVQAAAAPSRAPMMDRAELTARRQALAARLTGGAMRPKAPTSPGTAPPPAAHPAQSMSTSEAVDALKRRYEDKISAAKLAQSRKYADAAAAAMAKGDVVGAANAYRVAMSFDGVDAETAERAQEAQQKATETLAESYTKQGTYEERAERWPEAARSWSRVAQLKPNDPLGLDRAANAILKAEGDKHQAAEYAKRAIELSPDTIAYRLTLASIYVAADLNLAAKRELELAAKLAPNNVAVQTMLKKIQKSA
ncbi:MAG: DnaJ domain-containing protein [Myxococcales bacterium]|jgi:curved DNA-binding protein CbpA|nr:DnaJ domain-containing protein [Myxococcales bacterium]